ncbi:MAG: presqualene diphosphate synthase HpnD [Nitrospirae bacterium]|nr:MAG: presqualene diphosphate synthase HpnD [Nitrospirota bacterium]
MTSQEAQAYCTALAKRSGSNFYYSFFFLPPDRRDAMHAVYAFCREVDSVVDEPEPGSNPHDRLARWREELAGQYRTERNTVSPPVEVLSPVMTCLGGHIRRLGIPREYFDDIIAGVAMDLTIKRYATFRDLYQYCYRVASAVGLVCLKIFGARAPEAQTYAINLGIAFQLTNILRDLKTDGARGRIYLPMEDLTRFGHSEQDLLAGAYTPAFVNLMEFECRRAQEYYRAAEAALPEADRRALVPAEIMRAIYHTILERIEACHYRVFSRRITLSPPHRLAVALKAWLACRLSGRRSTPAGLAAR